MRFCGMCGARLPWACPACGFVNPPPFRFCGMCGTQLQASPIPPVLQEKGRPTASPPARLEGERRLATIIVIDVYRSTNLLERVGSEVWVEIMDRVLQLVESEIYRFGGQVDQFRGDGLVASFGATAAYGDDPERAVLAALAIHAAIEPYAADLLEREAFQLLVRVGVNSGEVILASVGNSSQYSEDTAMGEAIALAARMEAAAEPGTVLVSEDTYALVESQFDWESLGEIAIKGLSQPVAVYRPLAPRPDTGRSVWLKDYGIAPLLVGRDAQFDALRRSIEDLRAGRGGIVTMVGEEGMGKSHLVAQVRQYDARAQALRAEAQEIDLPGDASRVHMWLRGRCRSYERSLPYSMWLDLLRGWLGVREGEPKAASQNRLRLQAEALWGYRMSEYYPFLATFLSLPLEEEYSEQVRHLDAEGVRQQVFLAIRGWIQAMAVRRPLILIFDDVHWADASSLELLRYCLPLCEQQAVLWLILFRLERTSIVWEFHHRLETEYPHRLNPLSLPPLKAEQSDEMIDRMIGPRVLPEDTRTLLIQKAEGNPYYIEELVRSLIREGALDRDPRTGRWHTTRTVTTLDLPDTLRNLLLAQIDDLLPAQRRVLQMAAVIGSVFWTNVLRVLVDDQDALADHLTALQRAQLIRDRSRLPGLGTEYVFRSALIRDVAYESLLAPQKVTCHRQVAEYLEGFYAPEVLPQVYDLLAYHYCRAGAPEKELFYTLKAADRAREVYANAEALRYDGHALHLLGEMDAQTSEPDRLEEIRRQWSAVLSKRLNTLRLTGDAEAARADAQVLLQLAGQLEDDPALMVDALLQQPGVAVWQNRDELAAGMPLAERALALAQELEDQRRQMQSLSAIANQRLYLNEPTGWELAERALALARQLGDRRHELQMLIGMGRVYVWSDQPERSTAYLEAALPICHALDDKIAEMRLLHLIGMRVERSGDYYRLLTEYEQKRLRISREIGHRRIHGDALMHCAQVQGIYLGDHDAALRLLRESQGIVQGSPAEVYVLLRIVQIRCAQGRHGEALEVLESARQIGETDRALNEMGRAGLNLVAAALYTALADRAHLELTLDLAAQTGIAAREQVVSRQYEMAAECVLAAAHLGLSALVDTGADRQVHREQALASSGAAVALYRSFDGTQVIECVGEEILYRHSQALAANGRDAEGNEYLERAYREMMRKHDLVPAGSPFRHTYLERIPLHREIRAAHAARWA
jgi:class 3 adenylate cyclase